jgi:hypothetical protein
MIEVTSNIDDMCHDCPDFTPDVSTERLYAYDKPVIRRVTVRCQWCNVCANIRRYLESKSKEELHIDN